MKYPNVVSREEWRRARLDLLAEEKAATRARDALNARRRKLPMTQIEDKYVFQSPKGELRLVDLFEGGEQLIVYHNMLKPDSDHICPGCSLFSDNLGSVVHLRARRTTFVMVSRATLPHIERVKSRFGWSFPWYSCHGTTFHDDFVTSEDKASFGLSVFVRQDQQVFQTYFTSGRGVEYASNTFSLLDLTAWGRQETWEDSPQGRPQEAAHSWLRLHDQYES